MNATVQSISASTCSHRTITFDVGAFSVNLADIQNADPDTFEELKVAVITVLKHQYLTRRAAGRTAAQALNDLVGFTVRV